MVRHLTSGFAADSGQNAALAGKPQRMPAVGKANPP